MTKPNKMKTANRTTGFVILLFTLLLLSGEDTVASPRASLNFIVTEQDANPQEAFKAHIVNSISYPSAAQGNEFQALITASFLVTKNGDIRDIIIEHTTSKYPDNVRKDVINTLTSEVKRVLSSVPSAIFGNSEKDKTLKQSFLFRMQGDESFNPDCPANTIYINGISQKNTGSTNETEIMIRDKETGASSKIFDKNVPKDAQPLVIIDGTEAHSLNDVSPDAIESIAVLKGEKAMEQYGERAKNGVIIITKKK